MWVGPLFILENIEKIITFVDSAISQNIFYYFLKAKFKELNSVDRIIQNVVYLIGTCLENLIGSIHK